MDIHKLEIFVDLASTLRYTETAERLFTTQGNVSKQIQALEKELDTQLFIREHRTVRLTEAGTLVLDYAKRIVRTYNEMNRSLHQQQESETRELVIRTIPSVSNYDAFNVITAFHQQHPDIQLRITEGDPRDLLQSLDDGTSDVIFARRFDTDEPGYEKVIMESDHFVAVLPINHPLAQETRLDLRQLDGEEFYQLGDRTRLLEPVLNLMKQAGVADRITYEGDHIDIIMNFVARGMGVSIMMDKIARGQHNPEVAIVPLKTNQISELAFVRPINNNTEASDLFWRFCQRKN